MSAINRFFSPTKFRSRNEFIASGIKCVFISYQKQDREQARKVAGYLQDAGIEIFFDEYDSELRLSHQSNNPKKVTEAICTGINNSSHMLVIVSPSTVNSTWVPFEIGYGYEKTDLAILCLKGIPKGSLPEYIRTAKIVRDIYDLNGLISTLRGLSKEYLVETSLLSDYKNAYNPLNNIMDSIIND